MIAARVLVSLAVAGLVQSPPFRAETRLVVLHATVRNHRGELVTNLDRPSFTVYENGRRQPIAVFRRDDLPVSLGLLIDNSGSMRPVRARVEQAALAFARASNPMDEMFVINFADKVRIDVPFTSDVGVIEAGIGRVDSIGGTALRDSIDAAETYLQARAKRDRKVLLVITDGNDNASVASLDRIRKAAERNEIVIYAVALLADSSRAKAAHRELDDLAERTGGSAYYPPSIEAVDDVAVDIARQIRQQYTLAYAPLNQALDGSYRRIRISVAGPEHFSVRTRAGYRAEK